MRIFESMVVKLTMKATAKFINSKKARFTLSSHKRQGKI